MSQNIQASLREWISKESDIFYGKRVKIRARAKKVKKSKNKQEIGRSENNE